MATLFDPLSIAVETVKTIEGVGSHRPDPPRFRVWLPIDPGEWAKKEAFQRQHDLNKWSSFHAKAVTRVEKKSLGVKLPRILSKSSAVSEEDSELEVSEMVASEGKVVKIASKIDSTSTMQGPEDEDEYEIYTPEEDDEDEEQKMSKMSTNQRRYFSACKLFQVTVNRKVFRFIDQVELVLSMMKMSDPEFKAILSALVTNDIVERLDLTEMRLSPHQLVYLTDFFTEDNAVTDLILADNNLGGRIIQGFFSTLASKDHLVFLNISGNDLRDKDAQFLADYVKTSETLLYLYMRRNNFTEKSGDVFGKMIGENTSVVDLDISANRIRCLGAEKFLRGFAKNTSVQRLDFSWNGLGEEGLKALGLMLRKNSTLINLILTGSRITGADLDLLYPAFKKNQALQRLVLSHNPFLMSDITAFLKEMYKWTTSGIQRIDFGPYQTVETAAVPLIDLLFWEKKVDIRYGGTLTHSKQRYKFDEFVSKLRDDPLALVSRLKTDERMKLVKYFGQLDLDTAIEEGEVEIRQESFLNKVRNNKVTFRDLANRIRRAGGHPYDVIRTILDMEEIVAAGGRPVPRLSIAPDVARRIYIRARSEVKMMS